MTPEFLVSTCSEYNINFHFILFALFSLLLHYLIFEVVYLSIHHVLSLSSDNDLSDDDDDNGDYRILNNLADYAYSDDDDKEEEDVDYKKGD